MNPLKYLKNLSMSLGAFVALGVVACGFVFAVAAFLRCLLFAWHKGWTLFAVMACLLLSPIGHSTPVWFPLVGITGSANNRDLTIIPDPSQVPLIYGSNLVMLQTLVLHPVRGNTTNELLPWGYTMRIEGWPRSAHFNVPLTTNVVNVTSLLTNALAIGFPVSIGSAPAGFSGTISNLVALNSYVFTNAAGPYVYSVPQFDLEIFTNGICLTNVPGLNSMPITAWKDTTTENGGNNGLMIDFTFTGPAPYEWLLLKSTDGGASFHPALVGAGYSDVHGYWIAGPVDGSGLWEVSGGDNSDQPVGIPSRPIQF